MKKLLNFFLGFVANPAIEELGAFGQKALENYYAKNPKACAAMVAGLYPFVDTIVEDLTKKTDTPYDDKVVAEIKQELEEFAALKGFTLTNLDND